MPKIQAYQRTKTITGEGANVTMTGTAGIGKAVSTMGEMGTKAADSVSDFMAAQKRAERAVLAQRYEQELKGGIDEALMSFDNDGNWQGYDEKSQNFVKGLKEKHLDTIEDPVLKKSAEVYFMGQTRNFERTIRRQKLQLMTKESQARFDVDYADSLKKYVYETDPQLKDLTKKEIELKGYELESRKLLKPGQTAKLMQTFDQKADLLHSKELIQANPEVAFASLTERDDKGQYTRLTNLSPEDRISAIKEARSAVVTNHYETERKERDLQEATKSDLFNKLDNKGYSRQKLLAEVQAAEVKDPVTGMRKLSPETAHAMRRTILKGDGDDEGGNSAEFIRLGNRIVGGQMKNTDEIIQSTGLKSNEKKVLANMFWTQDRRDDKAQTAEEKAISLTFKNNRKFIIDSANKTIDSLFPVAGDKSNKAMNTSLKANILIASERYDADTINDFRQYTDDTIKYAQTEASKTFSWKKKIADAILGAVKPELNVKGNAPATQKTATGTVSEQDARSQLTAKGITGKAQDDWIAQYKAAGKVK
jgi:hypothetical protein